MRSVFSKHSHDRHTIARPHGRDMGCFCELKAWFHIPYQLLQFCIQPEVYILYSSALWRHSAVCRLLIVPPLTGRSSCSRQEREICTDNIAKHYKIRECFSMAMSKELLCFANKFRCIQSCEILHMQNIARLYNHWRLIVNISNKRFLISVFLGWASCPVVLILP